jgi:predicted MFS family arabinose efflux permease
MTVFTRVPTRLGTVLRARSAMTVLGHADFRRLWAGQTISVFGSQITTLALPLAAVLVLHASTLQVGMLSAATYAAFLGIGLPVGVWADRMPRRPIMIAADLTRAVVLTSVPIAFVFGSLTMAQLYAVALIQGVGTVFFDVAYMSYLPGLVGREHIVEANAKLQISQSVAQVSGPSIGGLLVGLLTAPVAIAADAASYVVSILSLATIRYREPSPVRSDVPSMRAEVAEGLRYVLRHPILRMICGATATDNFFTAAFYALSVVFLVRRVGLSATVIGLLISAGSLGAVIGASTATLLRRRIGSARIIWMSLACTAPFALLYPLTVPGAGLAFFAGGLFVVSFGAIVYNVNQTACRQLLCPVSILGRVNATVRFIVWGTLPVGGVLGGALGSWLGLRDAVLVAAIGTALSPLWLVVSPLRSGRDLPTT